MLEKVIVISGATSGIGRASALAFAAAGWHVAVCGRRSDRLESLREEADLALAESVDVSDAAAVGRFFERIRRELGRVDVAFNNAGVDAPTQNFGDLGVDTWHRVMGTNLNGAFYMAREAFRLMREQAPQGGRIINNGSIAAHVPRYGASAYAVSKAAMTGLTKSISLDGRPYNIACGQLDLGNPMTDMIKDTAKARTQADGSLAPEPTFDVKHVVDALLYMANLPLEANVQFMTVMATAMPYIGRG